jgi:hypothetical protein
MILKRQLTTAALVISAAMTTTLTARNVVVPQAYMFGFAASFNDTIVHFTEVQAVDSVWMDSKTHFLSGRVNYSNALREYLASQQFPHRTCVVIFDKNLKRLQKKYMKMKKLYAGDGKKARHDNDIRTIATSEFRFRAVNMGDNEDTTESGK